MRRLSRAWRRRRGEGGFTLVELLVVMAAGMVVMFATLGFLELSMRQSASATDRVEASQHGRTAMEQLMQELHSACVWASTPAVQQSSDNNNVWFISQFSSAPVPTPLLHWVSFSNGTLKDTQYSLSNPNTPPANWTTSAFNTNTPTAIRTFATNVTQATVNNVVQPVFQYYQYVNGQIAADSAHLVSTPLSSSTAGNVAEIVISFAAQPSSGSTATDRTINLTDADVIVPPPSSTPQCQ